MKKTFSGKSSDKPISREKRDSGASGEGKQRYEKSGKKFSGNYSDRNNSRFKKKSSDFVPSGAPADESAVRLNKFIANAGICSRREADDLIGAGVIAVNGKVVTQMGIKIFPTDEVRFHDRVISGERKRYLVLNKPKDYITTMDDPLERKTVMSLIQNACKERVYPVGRLDRQTTGVLLFTNDGNLAKKLTHPSHNIKKIYLVELDKSLTKVDLDQILKGVELDDGKAIIDEISFGGEGRDKSEILVELHLGRNRIVRRIFETLGYSVKKLDRVSFAGITKKELMKGKWRFLTDKEVGFLQVQSGQK